MKAGTLRDLTALTSEQEKAFKRMQKAHKDFLKAGGRYYVALDSVQGYNGHNFDGVDGDESCDCDELLHANDLSFPSIEHASLSGFADDAHYFIPARGVQVLPEHPEDAE